MINQWERGLEMSPDAPLIELFNNIFENPVDAKKIIARVEKYSIRTCGEFHGALNPIIENFSEKDANKRCLSPSFKNAIKKNSKKNQIIKIKNVCSISSKKAEKVLAELEKVKKYNLLFKDNPSFQFYGVKGAKKGKSSYSWKNIRKPSSFPLNFILPNYHKMGPVFNQGERGTCVANAVISVLDYITGKRLSRQFLYHQCKMVDGIMNEEGTYIKTAIDIICREKKDPGTVDEFIWGYNPYADSTRHQGPPPEKCYKTTRFTGNQSLYIRQNSMISDIKTILVSKNRPVAVGLDIFESFDNQNSYRTGTINLPFPGEFEKGGHAMVVVGYDDKDKYFIVRNSWGEGWAFENRYGYPGHALIPYTYFKKYMHFGAAFIESESVDVNISPKNRLSSLIPEYLNRYKNETNAADLKKVGNFNKIFQKLFGVFK